MTLEEARRYFRDQAGALTSSGMQVRAFVLDASLQ
jgi:hypothetical protein